MRRIAFQKPLKSGLETDLEQGQLHYLFDVLRMDSGDNFIAISSEGIAFIAELGSKTTTNCKIIEHAGETGREPSLAVTLFVPLLKGDKLELVIQKAVELGVSQIILYLAQRSIVKPTGNLDKKILRLQKIANDATLQSRRHKVPVIQGMFSLSEASASIPGIFAWEEEQELSLSQCITQYPPLGQVSLLTGPEGGLSSQEAEILLRAGWKSVSLGPRILRAETAAMAVLACTMFACGEMG